MLHASAHPDWSLDQLVATARAVEERLRAPDRRDALAFLAESPRPGSLRDALTRVTRCRSAARDGSWSADPPPAPTRSGPAARLPWHQLWAERRHDYAIVYGHWALQGLHVEAGLRGLDTACVHHGRDGIEGWLTAWLPDPSRATPFGVPDDRFWQIPAMRARARARSGSSEDPH